MCQSLRKCVIQWTSKSVVWLWVRVLWRLALFPINPGWSPSHSAYVIIIFCAVCSLMHVHLNMTKTVNKQPWQQPDAPVQVCWWHCHICEIVTYARKEVMWVNYFQVVICRSILGRYMRNISWLLYAFYFLVILCGLLLGCHMQTTSWSLCGQLVGNYMRTNSPWPYEDYF